MERGFRMASKALSPAILAAALMAFGLGSARVAAANEAAQDGKTAEPIPGGAPAAPAQAPDAPREPAPPAAPANAPGASPGEPTGGAPAAAPAPAAAKPGASGATDLGDPRTDKGPNDQPPPLLVDYAQYGVALAGMILFDPGALCPEDASSPCIIGGGGGPVLRGGWRPAGPWYIGGAYQFAKLDSNNLYRLGILQELRAEMRYFVEVTAQITPYATWALGGMLYGNEFGAETGGAMTMVGIGVEFEVTRFAVVGLNAAYEPMVFVGFEDSTGQRRDTGVSQFMHLELVIELRTELGRE